MFKKKNDDEKSNDQRRKLKKKAEKNKALIKKENKSEISFFINPMPCHRIYRDFLIPDFSFTNSSPSYLFQNNLFYKNISEIHIRQKGVILQFNEINPSYITPLGLIKERLNSMGNIHAYNLSNSLDNFFSYFEKTLVIKEEDQSKLIPPKDWEAIYFDILQKVDEIFKENQEDILIIQVHQSYAGIDNRLLMVGMNEELTNWLVANNDKKKLEDFITFEAVEPLLQVVSYPTFENHIEELNYYIKNHAMQSFEELQKNYIKGNINTIIGNVRGDFQIRKALHEIKGEKFMIICSVFKKEDQNKFLKRIGAKEEEEKDDQNVASGRNFGKNWANLLNTYYPKVFKGTEKKN